MCFFIGCDLRDCLPRWAVRWLRDKPELLSISLPKVKHVSFFKCVTDTQQWRLLPGLQRDKLEAIRQLVNNVSCCMNCCNAGILFDHIWTEFPHWQMDKRTVAHIECTFINVFKGRMFSFHQYKSHESNQTLHTGPSNVAHESFVQSTSQVVTKNSWFMMLIWPCAATYWISVS